MNTTNNRIPIQSKQGITIYGREIDHKRKLGRFEVYAPSEGRMGPYSTYAEAESVYKHLIDKLNK
jgi:hypothetical protein